MCMSVFYLSIMVMTVCLAVRTSFFDWANCNSENNMTLKKQWKLYVKLTGAIQLMRMTQASLQRPLVTVRPSHIYICLFILCLSPIQFWGHVLLLRRKWNTMCPWYAAGQWLSVPLFLPPIKLTTISDMSLEVDLNTKIVIQWLYRL